MFMCHPFNSYFRLVLSTLSLRLSAFIVYILTASGCGFTFRLSPASSHIGFASITSTVSARVFSATVILLQLAPQKLEREYSKSLLFSMLCCTAESVWVLISAVKGAGMPGLTFLRVAVAIWGFALFLHVMRNVIVAIKLPLRRFGSVCAVTGAAIVVCCVTSLFSLVLPIFCDFFVQILRSVAILSAMWPSMAVFSLFTFSSADVVMFSIVPTICVHLRLQLLRTEEIGERKRAEAKAAAEEESSQRRRLFLRYVFHVSSLIESTF